MAIVVCEQRRLKQNSDTHSFLNFTLKKSQVILYYICILAFHFCFKIVIYKTVILGGLGDLPSCVRLQQLAWDNSFWVLTYFTLHKVPTAHKYYSLWLLSRSTRAPCRCVDIWLPTKGDRVGDPTMAAAYIRSMDERHRWPSWMAAQAVDIRPNQVPMSKCPRTL